MKEMKIPPYMKTEKYKAFVKTTEELSHVLGSPNSRWDWAMWISPDKKDFRVEIIIKYD